MVTIYDVRSRWPVQFSVRLWDGSGEIWDRSVPRRVLDVVDDEDSLGKRGHLLKTTKPVAERTPGGVPFIPLACGYLQERSVL